MLRYLRIVNHSSAARSQAYGLHKGLTLLAVLRRAIGCPCLEDPCIAQELLRLPLPYGTSPAPVGILAAKSRLLGLMLLHQTASMAAVRPYSLRLA